MKHTLEAVAGGYNLYQARSSQYDNGQKIPFRVSPEPLYMTTEQKHEIQLIGSDAKDYFHSVDELYRTDGVVREILNTGKPEIFLTDNPSQYLFIRPDIIITPTGFSICEIETSPFGLALAELLNRGYTQEGYETLVDNGTLPAYVSEHTPIEGKIIYSQKTKSFAGQMTFLADEVFSDAERKWVAENVSNSPIDGFGNIYRGFYMSEYMSDPKVRMLLERHSDRPDTLLPSPTPHMEEKAILAFIWDIRFEAYFRKTLGDAAFNHLRVVIPPTWIVGQERYFAPGMPDNVGTSVDLAVLSRAKRAFVLKSSGFARHSSWAEGVHFLHEKSGETARKLLHEALTQKSTLYVIQQYIKGQKTVLQYEGESGELIPMVVKIRLTPYFAMSDGKDTKLIAVKATGCENTDYIHASSTSINTSVGYI